MQHTLNQSTCFVVSGGARGITAHCVIRLAQRYQCRFILLGRSARHVPESALVAPGASEADMKPQIISHLQAQGEKPTPVRVQQIIRAIQAEHEIDATLHAIAQAGGQAEYLSVSITDAAAVQAALPPLLQRMDGTAVGFIHGAGVLADKLIEQKTLEDFERVYAVKITGLANVLACIPPTQLAYLVLFASVAGFYGNVGQSDYALANEVLNKAAHQFKRTYPSCRVVSINWGPWDGGMVTPAIKELFASRNMAVIPLDAGAQMLIHELEEPDQATQVVIGSPITPPPNQQQRGLQSFRIRRRLTLAANPFLHDHVIGDHAVLPTVVSISWLANVCEQCAPGYTFYSCHDYKVLKGITFDETLAHEYIIDLKELDSASAGEIAFEALIWSETSQGQKRYHYGGQIGLRQTLPDAPTYPSFDRAEGHVIPGSQLYRDGTLFHGPSFQGVEQVVNITPQKLTMRCCLPVIPIEQQGQFPIQTFNPYQADIQYQCMLIWVRHFHQAGSLPLRADTIEYFRPVTPGGQFWVSMDVQQSTESKLVAEVTTHDDQGIVAMRVTGAEVTISARLNQLFLAGSKL